MPEENGVMIYSDRRQFLIASASSGGHRFQAKHGDDTWYGLAATENQFRKALCEVVFPDITKLSRDSMTRLMADELAGTGAQ